MAIRVDITDRKFFNEFKNGTSFGDNPNDFTRNLTGNVMEKIKVLTRYETLTEVQLESPQNDPANAQWDISFSGTNLVIEKNDDVSWNDEGFFLGQICFVTAVGTLGQVDFRTGVEITKVAGDKIEIDIGIGSYPFTVSIINVRNQQFLTALVYNFGLIENDSNYSSTSLVTQNSMGYYSGSIGSPTGAPVVPPLFGRSTSFINLQQLGKFKDFVSGTSRARFVTGELTGTVQTFEVEHTLTIHPWYLEGDLDNLINGVLPQFLEGTASLKYVNEAEWREGLNDPNRKYETIDDSTLGSVGWFDESFNGFNNNYRVNNVNYEEDITAANADGIIVSGRTKIIIEVEKINGSFVVGDRFGTYISYLPLEEDYIGTEETNLLENFIYDRALGIANGSSTTGDDFIQDLSATVLGGILTIECIVEYNNDQKIFLSNRLSEGVGNYVIGVQVGDNSLTSKNSDRVIIKADVGTYDENADIDGLSVIENFLIYPHNELIGIGNGFSNMTSWNEDGLSCTFDIVLDLNKDAFLNNLTFALIAYNENTEDFFILNQALIDLSTAPVSGGVQQIEIDSTRGYILQENSQFNFLKITTGVNVGGMQSYQCNYAQKITWQDWIENLAVNEVFVDTSKPNNNQNLKASNYSLKEDYTIRIAIISELFGTSDLGVSGLTDYLQISQPITVYDYEEDGNPVPEWSAEIKTKRLSNDEDLFGSILSGEFTVMETTWTNSNGPVASIDDLWCIHRIEQVDQQGFDITELSSVRAFPDGQLLIPVDGSPLLKVELVAGNVVTTCLIDGNQIDPSINYNLSARIHNATATALPFKVTSPLSQIKDTAGTNQNKITAP